MDILKSSNVERVIFDKYGAQRTKEMMEALDKKGGYTLDETELENLREDFDAVFSTDEEGRRIIAEYAQKGYLMDPHTATCFKACGQLCGETLPAVLYSTAEWTKFSPTVARALGIDAENDLQALEAVSKRTGMKIPGMIRELFNKEIVHTTVVDPGQIKKEMLTFL
jgi:threonine synthase